MRQTSIWDDLPVLHSRFRYPELPDGLMKARLYHTDQGQYYVKNDEWNDTPDSHVVANEFLCGYLAKYLQLPVPQFAKVIVDEKTCFGSARVPTATPTANAAILGRCTNSRVVHRLVVFDFWVDNRDRHDRNILIEKFRGAFRFWAIDHSHCPLPPGRRPMHLEMLQNVGNSPICATEWIRSAIVDIVEIRRAIELIAGIPERLIKQLVAEAPNQSWDDRQSDQVATFFLERRELLKDLFRQHFDAFPNLKGGPI